MIFYKQVNDSNEDLIIFEKLRGFLFYDILVDEINYSIEKYYYRNVKQPNLITFPFIGMYKIFKKKNISKIQGMKIYYDYVDLKLKPRVEYTGIFNYILNHADALQNGTLIREMGPINIFDKSANDLNAKFDCYAWSYNKLTQQWERNKE